MELVNLVLNILVGGVDTTQSQLAHAMKAAAPEEGGSGRDGLDDNDRVLRYLAKVTEEPARQTTNESE